MSIEDRFIWEFQLTCESSSISCTEIYNDYCGFPYEGTAIYKVELAQDAITEVEKWSKYPITDEASEFINSLRPQIPEDFVFPEISEGQWCFVNRTPDSNGTVRNASLCIYDADNQIAYYLRSDS